MFQEYTVIYENPFDLENCEIMLHFNERGKLTRMYCYKDSIPCIEKFNENKGYYYVPYKTSPSINPLFVNLPNRLFPVLLPNIYFTEDTVEEFDKDDILQKAVLNYKNLQVI